MGIIWHRIPLLSGAELLGLVRFGYVYESRISLLDYWHYRYCIRLHYMGASYSRHRAIETTQAAESRVAGNFRYGGLVSNHESSFKGTN